ncbi:hypothetical protein RHMOL_Rhmol07G0160700 [Rhododendron molle]|uniref:Uncharacterized protein n=4 Tax=Rhododendron molle TaxID=49168 RepID=A0ACC0N2N9_RHOML|nr:hypothetical protein RHMOL_Rhmol07G0160700 [Rhododendron molle]KAI8546973.1 hypothetical protein RHMOL_Rhmol07G0160700 [Rhododendron molle]KAI8546974.1 hypothetical protein RHMOL_Rhmol07G0160700 [Rhododendron molle]KAI8546975.1 hypothetical protein RHMOL_Rhmol07G0160700 [Rhododendron molle]
MIKRRTLRTRAIKMLVLKILFWIFLLQLPHMVYLYKLRTVKFGLILAIFPTGFMCAAGGQTITNQLAGMV